MERRIKAILPPKRPGTKSPPPVGADAHIGPPASTRRGAQCAPRHPPHGTK